MSEDVLSKVVKMSYGRKIFPMEDIYVGLMMKELGINTLNLKGHCDLGYEGQMPSKCDMNKYFFLHPVSGKHLVKYIINTRLALEEC